MLNLDLQLGVDGYFCLWLVGWWHLHVRGESPAATVAVFLFYDVITWTPFKTGGEA